jgi:hypothetical protein
MCISEDCSRVQNYFLLDSGFMIWEDLRICCWKFIFIAFLYQNLDVQDYNLTRTQDLIDSWCRNLEKFKRPCGFFGGDFA